MVRHLRTFEWLINDTTLSYATFFLLFNKMDLFVMKLLYRPMSDYVPDYTGGPDTTKSRDYWVERFLAQVHNNREVKIQFTTATDPSFKSVLDRVHQEMLKRVSRR